MVGWVLARITCAIDVITHLITIIRLHTGITTGPLPMSFSDFDPDGYKLCVKQFMRFLARTSKSFFIVFLDSTN